MTHGGFRHGSNNCGTNFSVVFSIRQPKKIARFVVTFFVKMYLTAVQGQKSLPAVRDADKNSGRVLTGRDGPAII